MTAASATSAPKLAAGFAGELVSLAGLNQIADAPSSSSVFAEARREGRSVLARACKRLMLPGSGLSGLEQLEALAERASRGEPGIVFSWHPSNLDVPNLYTLLREAGRLDLFERFVFIAGRKLNESSPITRVLAERFPRLVVSPPSYFEAHRDQPEKLERARRENIRAIREAKSLLRQGRVLFLFPAGTRYRVGRPETGLALRQTDSYLRMAKNFVALNIHGNTLPPGRGAMEAESPRKDVLRMVAGPLTDAAAFRAEALAGAHSDPRRAVADKVMSAIRALN